VPRPDIDRLFTAEVVARFGKDTDTDIARDLGVSQPTVGQRRRKLGITKTPKPRRDLTREDIHPSVRWTVLSLAPRRKRKCDFTRWLCRCPCGVVKPVFQHALLTGRSKQCGSCGQRSRKYRNHRP
jgi:hypothetical protein